MPGIQSREQHKPFANMRIQDIPVYRMSSPDLGDDASSFSSGSDGLPEEDNTQPQNSNAACHQTSPHRSSSVPTISQRTSDDTAPDGEAAGSSAVQSSINSYKQQMHRQQRQHQLTTTNLRSYQKSMHAFTTALFDRSSQDGARDRKGKGRQEQATPPLCLKMGRLQLREGRLDSPTLGLTPLVIETGVGVRKTKHPPRSVGTSVVYGNSRCITPASSDDGG
ncbi:unnamed protein product [Zymoseptoria tritici ST99CH_1A5]|uniref:Uncharacterized protein n=1 Tax=Zymoseptoria tritici ST99CH_1A5 TaxID=1276529 RepID=A0A1Y6LHS8_ZYMTR|nr:unnamed protein product [Zymoseptoria tritici ST99CH_3D1]SMY22071.1 unnamed protein product [Zymoseptoria tritici ST99CH_1A5]